MTCERSAAICRRGKMSLNNVRLCYQENISLFRPYRLNETSLNNVRVYCREKISLKKVRPYYRDYRSHKTLGRVVGTINPITLGRVVKTRYTLTTLFHVFGTKYPNIRPYCQDYRSFKTLGRVVETRNRLAKVGRVIETRHLIRTLVHLIGRR